MDFLESENCEKNLLFWKACETLKREGNPAKIQSYTWRIYEEFIAESSRNEVRTLKFDKF